ncbi:hypothetical protein NDU88_000415 [Pleurodeles waltl]|uniref:IgGFc-binding protein N-terminal domain-containing protein n=1 Tax=Pleurodeles waltl TaxID=8319 RepID=A0AAV7WIZ7_PLEWA|nr:hypothetical protein NDU88_000415 [Pleurodeles waltl]
MQNCGCEDTKWMPFKILLRAAECCPVVTVSVLGTDFQQSETLELQQIRAIDIPSSAMLSGSSNSTKQTIIIKSDKLITVQSIGARCAGMDTTIVRPLEYLDHQYYVFTPPNLPDFFHEFALVNCEASNLVHVTFKGTVVYRGVTYNTGSTLTLMLAPYESVQFQSSECLTGSKVIAEQRVAVLSGHQCAQRYTDLSRGHIYEQLPPVSQWGTKFTVPPLSVREGADSVYVIASSSTNLQVYKGSGQGSTYQLNEGSTLALDVGSALMSLTADSPILVMFHCTGGLSYQTPLWAPFILPILPNDQFSVSEAVFAPGNYINRVVIVAPANTASNVKIVGQSPQVPIRWNSTSTATPSYLWTELTFSSADSHSYVVHQGVGRIAAYTYRLRDFIEAPSYSFAGKQFVTVFMESWDSASASRGLELFLHAFNCCTVVSLSLYGTTFQKRFLLQKGEYVRAQIPSSAMLSGARNTTNGTISIFSDNEIMVVSSSSSSEDRDTSVVYPAKYLGNEYYIVTPSTGQNFFHQFVIVNLNYANSVDITFKAYALFNRVSYRAGATLTLRLSPFENVQIQSNVSLTGSRVTAQRPVAVLSGHQGITWKMNFSFAHVYEQLLPVSRWGKSYVAAPLYIQPETNLVYVTVASTTNVWVYRGTLSKQDYSISAGETLALEVGSTPLYITGDKDMMVLFHAPGTANSSVIPFMFTIIPTKLFSSFHIVQGLNQADNRLLIVVHRDYTAQLEMDGRDLPATAEWNGTSSASAGHVYTDLAFQSGPHVVHHSLEKKMMAYTYNFRGEWRPA